MLDMDYPTFHYLASNAQPVLTSRRAARRLTSHSDPMGLYPSCYIRAAETYFQRDTLERIGLKLPAEGRLILKRESRSSRVFPAIYPAAGCHRFFPRVSRRIPSGTSRATRAGSASSPVRCSESEGVLGRRPNLSGVSR